MPEIVITEFLDEGTVSGLARGYDVHYDPDLVHKPDELVRLVADARAMIVRNRTQVRAPVLDAARRLRAVGRLGVGLDNIDVGLCEARGIKVCNAIGGNKVSVAEYVIAGLILLLRPGVFQATGRVFAGAWPRTSLIGGEAMGRRLGIVGYGNIGREVASRARPFGLDCVACDPYVAGDHPSWREHGARKVSLDELLATADAVTLHVPLSDETERMINSATLARMKRGAVLINSSRGPVADLVAVGEALKSGHLAGALIDVFDDEPLPANPPFADAPNLIATPHVAGMTEEAVARVTRMVVAAVREVLEGRS